MIVKETGLYTVDVSDASGCTGSQSVGVIAFDRPGLKIDPISVICPNDTIQLNAQTTDSLKSIQWSPSIGLSCTDCLNPLAYPKMTMIYTLTTIDTNGCSRIDTVKVLVIDSTALSIKNIVDTISICTNTKGIIQFPIRNTSSVDLNVKILSFTDPILSIPIDTILIPADSTIFIPIDFAGRPDTGLRKYGVNIADHCGTVKYAEWMIDIQQPDFMYKVDTISETCKTNVVEQQISIVNNNALKGTITLSSDDARVQFSKSSLYMIPFGTDSLSMSFRSDTIGNFPISIVFEHECGNKDTITWTVNVISNPFDIAWKNTASGIMSSMRFVKTLSIANQSKIPLNGNASFDLRIVHEQSSLSIDSVVSRDCKVIMQKSGDSILLTYTNCKDTSNLNTDFHMQSVIGETLRPWMSIASFTSKDPCIEPIIQNATDTIDLDAYGCELTTLSIVKSNVQLLAVALSSDRSMLNITYESSEKIPVNIRCMSTVGQITNALIIRDKDAGRHEVSIPVNGLSSGIYALIFESENYAASSLFMIME